MKSAGKARNNGLYRHIRTSKEIIRNLLNDSLKTTEKYAVQYANIPLVGRTIFEQQKLLYNSLLEWLDNFEAQMSKE